MARGGTRSITTWMIRTKAVPAVAVALGMVVIAAVIALQARASDGRQAQLELASVKTALNALQSAPFQANTRAGGSPARARLLMETDEHLIDGTLASLRRKSAPASLDRVTGVLRGDYALLERIYRIGATQHGYDHRADLLGAASGRQAGIATGLLEAASADYDSRASRADDQATVGSAVAISLLVLAFGFFYRRSVRARARAERLAEQNEELLDASRQEALTDSLTGLGNRRALVDDLDRALEGATAEAPAVLALFDLDGFKQYNDTFGHPAGDALLAQLGDSLAAAVDGQASVYRMGGDEFCLLAREHLGAAGAIVELAAEALSASGEAFQITSSFGSVLVPVEATTAAEALVMADRRMYDHKASSRVSASRQSTDVLLTALSERSAGLGEHLSGVAHLAQLTAIALELPEPEVNRIRLAAELHDVGKTAIPDAILNKPGDLDDHEWEFVRRHTIIGERIVLAAPSLAHTADLVRASHERVDGTGYPDRLPVERIPLGARIIAVCDAFDAMVSDRPYRRAMSVDAALAELRRCSGTQFDSNVVDAFCGLAGEAGLGIAA
jgi:diguanylate cyclase (GGDEF)-like protein